LLESHELSCLEALTLSNGCHPCSLSGACHIREYGHTFQLALPSTRLDPTEIRLSIHLAFAKVYDDGWLASFNAHRSTHALALTRMVAHACELQLDGNDDQTNVNPISSTVEKARCPRARVAVSSRASLQLRCKSSLLPTQLQHNKNLPKAPHSSSSTA
jgi:hypothetical protein